MFRPDTPAFLQQDASECGLASLAYVFSFHGFHLTLNELRGQAQSSSRGMTLADMMQICSDNRFSTSPLKIELESLAALSLPAILHWNLSHFVVLTAVRRSEIVVMDPAVGFRTIQLREVSRAFTGIALEVRPDGTAKRRRPPAPSALRLLEIDPDSRKFITPFLLAALCLEMLSLVAPLLVQATVDRVIATNAPDMLLVIALGFTVVALFQAFSTFGRQWTTLAIQRGIGISSARKLIAHVASLPFRYFAARHYGDVASRFTSFEVIQKTAAGAILENIVDIAVVALSAILLAAVAPLLVLPPLIATLLVVALKMFSQQRMQSAQDASIAQAAAQQNHMVETIRGMQSLKLNARVWTRTSGYTSLTERKADSEAVASGWACASKSAQTLLNALENVASVAIAARYVMAADLSIGMFYAALAYKSVVSQRMMAFVDRVGEVRALAVHCERASDLLATDAEAISDAGLQVEAPPDIEFKNVCARYDASSQWVLEELSFKVKSGEVVALVGESGSGKTTVVKALAGFIDHEKGDILVNGEIFSAARLRRVREITAAVLQEDTLFTGTIAENVTYFDPQPDWSRVKHALQQAAIYDEFQSLPCKLHTVVGDSTSVLSAGQRQRIFLARAFYRQPKLLILDEATSNLDSVTQQAVLSGIRSLHATTLLVAHRAEVIAFADRVIEIPQRALHRRRLVPAVPQRASSGAQHV